MTNAATPVDAQPKHSPPVRTMSVNVPPQASERDPLITPSVQHRPQLAEHETEHTSRTYYVLISFAFLYVEVCLNAPNTRLCCVCRYCLHAGALTLWSMVNGLQISDPIQTDINILLGFECVTIILLIVLSPYSHHYMNVDHIPFGWLKVLQFSLFVMTLFLIVLSMMFVRDVSHLPPNLQTPFTAFLIVLFLFAGPTRALSGIGP